MSTVITSTRWFRVLILAAFLVISGLSLYASAKVGQKDAPDAKLPADLPAPESPIALPAEMEVDIETDPFVVIPAKTKGQVKWLVHVDGSDKPIKTFAHPSSPILIVAVPKTGFVLVTAISAVKDEPFFAQTRVRAKGSSDRPLLTAAPTAPAQKLDVNLLYDVDKVTPELRAVLDGSVGKQLTVDGHAFHAYDYRSADAQRRKLTELVTRPGGGLPALIILDKGGRVLPDGKPLQVPISVEALLALVRKVAG
jgi:hypothetical protein